MHIFIALLIYIGIVGTSSIESFWSKSGLTIYNPIKFITFFWFEQIKQYFHMSALSLYNLPKARYHTKLEPLASLLRTKFQAYVVLGQNVSFDEMMVLWWGNRGHPARGLEYGTRANIPPLRNLGASSFPTTFVRRQASREDTRNQFYSL
jgi:hypothetical protein